MYESEGQSEGLPKSSFPIYVAEGDVLFKQGEYEKAVESYTTVSFHLDSNLFLSYCNTVILLG